MLESHHVCSLPGHWHHARVREMAHRGELPGVTKSSW
ncbi:hypothetical protein G1H11_10035 [Phytoactinopolyspora alkaliphila]|uniref:30S ribosomal protein S14 n=1 Tax=Phytoactinopolyspora alkaliphila TaxID=1783498 RepID=A0A6N9YKQ7_9ACTN|nr:hypothetical protein [Phytoactinopolyspora alkaliphila]